MRKLTLILAGALAVAAIAAAAAVAATRSVSVDDDFFSPKSVSIRKGDIVRWRWVGDNPHNVTGKGFRSATKRSGTYSHRFRRSGRFSVVCTIHSGMRMAVRVR